MGPSQRGKGEIYIFANDGRRQRLYKKTIFVVLLNRFHIPLILMVASFTMAVGISILEAVGYLPASQTPFVLLSITVVLAPLVNRAERKARQLCMQPIRK